MKLNPKLQLVIYYVCLTFLWYSLLGCDKPQIPLTENERSELKNITLRLILQSVKNDPMSWLHGFNSELDKSIARGDLALLDNIKDLKTLLNELEDEAFLTQIDGVGSIWNDHLQALLFGDTTEFAPSVAPS